MKSKHLKSKKDNFNKNESKQKNVSQHKKNKSKNKKVKRVFLNFLSLVFLGLMIYSGINIFLWWKDNQAGNKIMDEISSITQNGIDFERLKQLNEETIAYLKVNGTSIEYPVVKHSDNDFYLNHSFDKSENGAGWIFADYRDSFDKTDRNLIIYGHNRRDGSMFGTLKNILNEEWYKNEGNLKISLKTETEDQEYQVFSVYKIEKEDYYITKDFISKEYEEFLKTIKSRSIYNFNIDVNKDNKILTLSTCDNNNNYRVVLHAKRIK